jgi:hypothetical protein
MNTRRIKRTRSTAKLTIPKELMQQWYPKSSPSKKKHSNTTKSTSPSQSSGPSLEDTAPPPAWIEAVKKRSAPSPQEEEIKHIHEKGKRCPICRDPRKRIRPPLLGPRAWQARPRAAKPSIPLKRAATRISIDTESTDDSDEDDSDDDEDYDASLSTRPSDARRAPEGDMTPLVPPQKVMLRFNKRLVHAMKESKDAPAASNPTTIVDGLRVFGLLYSALATAWHETYHDKPIRMLTASSPIDGRVLQVAFINPKDCIRAHQLFPDRLRADMVNMRMWEQHNVCDHLHEIHEAVAGLFEARPVERAIEAVAALIAETDAFVRPMMHFVMPRANPQMVLFAHSADMDRVIDSVLARLLENNPMPTRQIFEVRERSWLDHDSESLVYCPANEEKIVLYLLEECVKSVYARSG